MKIKIPFTPEEIEFVKRNAGIVPVDDIAKTLSREPGSVRGILSRFGISGRTKFSYKRERVRHHYKKSLPPDKWRDMECFLKGIALAKLAGVKDIPISTWPALYDAACRIERG